MKIKFTQDVQINNTIYKADSEEEIEDGFARVIIRNGWGVDANAKPPEVKKAEPMKVADVIVPEKKSPEKPTRRKTEKAVTVEKSNKAKKPKKVKKDDS